METARLATTVVNPATELRYTDARPAVATQLSSQTTHADAPMASSQTQTETALPAISLAQAATTAPRLAVTAVSRL